MEILFLKIDIKLRRGCSCWALGMLRLEDHEFKVNQGYIGRPVLTHTKKKLYRNFNRHTAHTHTHTQRNE
jgi:hypothetical protein